MLAPDGRGNSGDPKQRDDGDAHVGKKGGLDLDEHSDLSFQDGDFAKYMCRRKRGKGIGNGGLK